MVTLAKGKQNVSACIFDVVMSCACALEPRIYNDCGNWSGPSTGLGSHLQGERAQSLKVYNIRMSNNIIEMRKRR